MSKKYIRKANLGSKRMALLDTISEVIEKYQDEGYKLTLRQLYYQLVSRDLIENSLNSYKRIGFILTEARYGGLVDWDAIEDRLRVPKLPYWVYGIEDALSDTVKSYRLNRQKGQYRYIEVWVEKDALSSVLERITSKYHVRLMVNRGYSSASAMYRAAERLQYHYNPVIIYLGDHDPSGLDMIRDIEDRLNEMLEASEYNSILTVDPIALNMDQIKKYNPPPNPAKITDSRAKNYISEHGNQSWELDALEPKVLNDLLEKSILSYIDKGKYQNQLKLERMHKVKIQKLIDSEES